MKRHRDYEEILHEREKIDAQSSVLWKELRDHPYYQIRQDQQTRLNLQRQLPSALVPLLCDEEKLIRLTVDRDVKDDNEGKPYYQWEFRCAFDGDEPYTISMELGEKHEEFIEIDFHPDPVRLWHRALDENGEELAPSLAAFCYACCEHLNEWDANPTKAFPILPGKKGKKEIKE